jgi:hypothetical protein
MYVPGMMVSIMEVILVVWQRLSREFAVARDCSAQRRYFQHWVVSRRIKTVLCIYGVFSFGETCK